MTTEQKVAATILEEPIGEVTIEGKTYSIPAPTTATLIMVSGLISELPEYDISQPDSQLYLEVLSKAKDGQALGQIAATLILGAKRIKARKSIWRLFARRKQTAQNRLAREILNNCTPGVLRELIEGIMNEAGISDFFLLTTSLHAKSTTRPTREVEATASGPSSEAGPSIGK